MNVSRLSPAFLASSMCLISLSASAQPSSVHATKSSDESTSTHIEISGGTGAGIFQDIQVPINEEASMRGDGTAIDAEESDHAGIPIYAGIGYVYHPNTNWTWHVLTFDAMQMRASTGPAATQSSSYSRVNLTTAGSYAFAIGSYSAELGATAGARRTSFSNVSDSHFINAFMVGGSLGLASASTAFSLFGSAAPVVRFGYSDDAYFGGGRELKGSTATLSEAGARLAFRLSPAVWLELGAEREMARITIEDISQYNNLGLSVLDPEHTSRVYNLATTVARVGFRKDF